MISRLICHHDPFLIKNSPENCLLCIFPTLTCYNSEQKEQRKLTAFIVVVWTNTFPRWRSQPTLDFECYLCLTFNLVLVSFKLEIRPLSKEKKSWNYVQAISIVLVVRSGVDPLVIFIQVSSIVRSLYVKFMF